MTDDERDELQSKIDLMRGLREEYAILNGLPEEFWPTVNVIKALLQTIKELTIEWITPFLVDREKEISRQLESGGASLVARQLNLYRPGATGGMSGGFYSGGASSAGQKGPVCYGCGQRGHIKADCPELKQQDPMRQQRIKELTEQLQRELQADGDKASSSNHSGGHKQVRFQRGKGGSKGGGGGSLQLGA